MKEKKIITGKNADEIWEQINTDFSSANLHDYHTVIQEENWEIELSIISSPGGSEEGGYDTTTLSAAIPQHIGFRFAIQPEDFLNKIRKLIGMQDIKTGYAEFDDNVIVQTNDANLFKRIFEDSEIRELFQSLSGYSFKTIDNEKEGSRLELYIQHATANSNDLKKIFNAFHHVLATIQ
jgi:hypothetical protein